ncbi:hypothetical protein Vadar_026616 [Vaccinium darrowii]|uniref:Uncharacterized protein n=1 Tax=Vaccinium darrowii TaxID=229202 RepID=A0ACB7XTD0_9ERIC|nr:hypothetical protein Vadar_026616 [Vaccinium darrowii]
MRFPLTLLICERAEVCTIPMSEVRESDLVAVDGLSHTAIKCSMKSYRLAELTQAQVNSLKARPRIDFSFIFNLGLLFLVFISRSEVACLFENSYSSGSGKPYSPLLCRQARSSNPESEPQLKLFLPLIASCFGGSKSVNETIEELKKHQLSNDATVIITEFSTFYEQWQSEPRRLLQGLEKELPFRSA